MKHTCLGDLGVAVLGLGATGMSFAYDGHSSDDPNRSAPSTVPWCVVTPPTSPILGSSFLGV
ncbi:MAG TPA: hypothetical protein VHN80_02490 [Kineosporiaceae bacterium]|nr:hypothetical protein [Kineosporiaceae bacterium]